MLADPEAPWSDSDWETITEESVSGSDLDEEEERALENAFVKKVKGETARPVRNDVQAFVKKVREINARREKVRPISARRKKVAAVAAAVFGDAQAGFSRDLPVVRVAAAPIVPIQQPGSPIAAPAAVAQVVPDTQPGSSRALRAVRAAARAAPKLPNELPKTSRGSPATRGAVAAPILPDEQPEHSIASATAGPFLPSIQPGTTRVLTAAEAALALTNEQAGTSVTMEDLRTAGGFDSLGDNEDTYRWTVGNGSM